MAYYLLTVTILAILAIAWMNRSHYRLHRQNIAKLERLRHDMSRLTDDIDSVGKLWNSSKFQSSHHR